MRHRKSRVVHGCLVTAVTALSICALPLPARAATASTNAIRVSPALSNIQLSAGETSTTIMANVTNLTSAPLVITPTARDFGASTVSSSAISFYDSHYDPATNPHGLQTSISFENTDITLAPKATQKVPITLEHVDTLAAGGHYGAVLFSPAPQAETGKRTKVSIHSAVASLIFLKTASGGTQTLRLLPLSASTVRFSLPVTNYIAFKDVGNTQSAPQGQLTLYGPGGSIVSTTVLNPGSGLILPGTSRLFTVTLPAIHQLLARPGVYRLELQYRDSSQSTFTVVNERFFYPNLALTIPALFIGFLLLFLLIRFGGKLLRTMKALIPRVHKRKPAPEEPKKPKKPPLIQG